MPVSGQRSLSRDTAQSVTAKPSEAEPTATTTTIPCSLRDFLFYFLCLGAFLFSVSAAITAWTESEIVWLFLLCGMAGLLISALPQFSPKACLLLEVVWLC